jgi:hypothetical protein
VLDQRQAFLEEHAGDLAERRGESVLARARLDLLRRGELLLARDGMRVIPAWAKSLRLYAITLTLL